MQLCCDHSLAQQYMLCVQCSAPQLAGAAATTTDTTKAMMLHVCNPAYIVSTTMITSIEDFLCPVLLVIKQLSVWTK